ncbi:MAG: hydrogenase iron-sulfur subunit [Deltaproteobacteria bacterium]|nr:hydrogenase iron-sulfur subunit [Deltaproteobacteria bacterium]
MSYEPKILVFACNWCSYAAADLAGTSRLSYPANLRLIRVMCTGMVHPGLVMEAFLQGADAVLVMGCHPGECHYLDGNLKAEARLAVVEEMMEVYGLEPERFRLVWCSSSEAERFAAAATQMTDLALSLGPNPLMAGDGQEVA